MIIIYLILVAIGLVPVVLFGVLEVISAIHCFKHLKHLNFKDGLFELLIGLIALTVAPLSYILMIKEFIFLTNI